MVRNDFVEERPLAVLGIDDLEERVYRYLLTHSGATAADVAKGLSMTQSQTQRSMDGVVAKGLATHTPERRRRYIPSPPDLAIGLLILQHQGNLKRAQEVIQELQKQAEASRPGEPEQMLEIISSSESERQVFEQVHRTAQQEVLSLMRAPMRIARLEALPEEEQSIQREAQARGVCYRSITDTTFLALPGAIARIRYDMEGGELIRVVPELPIKMMLTDHRIAIVPLELQRPDGPLLLIRSSPLLDALYSLFQILWESSTPMSLKGLMNPETAVSDLKLSEKTKNLLTLLAAGLNDKNAAALLGIAPRTYDRRIKELMKDLNVRTRFQAGWLAAIKFSDMIR